MDRSLARHGLLLQPGCPVLIVERMTSTRNVQSDHKGEKGRLEAFVHQDL